MFPEYEEDESGLIPGERDERRQKCFLGVTNTANG